MRSPRIRSCRTLPVAAEGGGATPGEVPQNAPLIDGDRIPGALQELRSMLPEDVGHLGPTSCHQLAIRASRAFRRSLDPVASLEGLRGDMEVHRRGLQAAVAEEELDGPEIGPCLEEVRGEAMPQRMRPDTLLHPGLLPGLGDGPLDRGDGERRLGGPPGEEPLWRPVGLPVGAELPQKRGREGDVAVLAALARLDAEDHPLAVDVLDAEVECLGDAQAGGVDRLEEGAVLEEPHSRQDPRDLYHAEDHGELLGALGEGEVLDREGPAECLPVEEAQGADGLVEGGPGCPGLLDEVDLVLADVGRAEEVRRLAEVPGEGGHPLDVGLDGLRRVVADPEILDHPLAQRCHWGLLS